MNYFAGLFIFMLIFYLRCIRIDATTRIVNGTDAEPGEFPFAVSLRYNSRHTCGGTILNNRFVLSAAHCVCNDNNPRNNSAYSIQYGLIEITAEPMNTRNVNKIYCHDFDSERLVNDCAVLELETPLPDDGTWKPVTISENFVTEKAQTGIIIGWGKTGTFVPLCIALYDHENYLKPLSVYIVDINQWPPEVEAGFRSSDIAVLRTKKEICQVDLLRDAYQVELKIENQNEPISRKLQKLEVDIFDDETCAISRDNTHHICFGAMSGGACNGDSGTALLVDGIQVGIASFITNKCGVASKKYPNVYSRVATYYTWITDVIGE